MCPPGKSMIFLQKETEKNWVSGQTWWVGRKVVVVDRVIFKNLHWRKKNLVNHQKKVFIDSWLPMLSLSCWFSRSWLVSFQKDPLKITEKKVSSRKCHKFIKISKHKFPIKSPPQNVGSSKKLKSQKLFIKSFQCFQSIISHTKDSHKMWEN